MSKNIAYVSDLYKSFQSCQVSTDISKNDTMHSTSPDPDQYMLIGEDAINVVIKSLVASGLVDVRNVLDFPCGHGRVLRHLVKFFPNSNIVGCDIDTDGVDYCKDKFAITGRYSNQEFDIEFENSFDLIWCGSLLTHLPEKYFEKAIDLMTRNLSDKGIVIATLHGRFSIYLQHDLPQPIYMPMSLFEQVEKDYNKCGFGYVEPYPQFDNYGFAITSPSYVMNSLTKRDDIRIHHFQERGWAGHQDVVVFGKPTLYLPFSY